MSGLDVKLLVNKHLGSSEYARCFARIMSALEYPPTHFSTHEPIQAAFLNDALDEFESVWRSQGASAFGQVLFRRREAPRYSGAVNFLRGPKASFNSVSFHGLAESFHRMGHRRSVFCSAVDRLFIDLGMSYGRICLKDDFEKKNIQTMARHADGSIEPRRPIGLDWRVSLPGVYWCNYFGEPYFSWFSSGVLESCPAHSVTLIGERVVRVLAYEDPAEAGSAAAQVAERAIREHLGLSAFFDRNDAEKQHSCPFSDHLSFSSLRG